MMERNLRGRAPYRRGEHAPSDDLLTIRQVADQYGVTMRALRFYEARGLLNSGRVQPASGTTRNSIRTYDAGQLRQLGRILKAKALGFTLTETRALLASSVADAADAPSPAGADLPLGPGDAAQRIARLEQQRDSLDRAIAELKAVWMSGVARESPALRRAG